MHANLPNLNSGTCMLLESRTPSPLDGLWTVFASLITTLPPKRDLPILPLQGDCQAPSFSSLENMQYRN